MYELFASSFTTREFGRRRFGLIDWVSTGEGRFWSESAPQKAAWDYLLCFGWDEPRSSLYDRGVFKSGAR
jgi:hypothetical protein